LNIPRQISFIILFCFFVFNKTGAQSISFSHLNTSNGLSDNNVRSMAVDKSGFLWIGTAGGLNLFDGYAITGFLKEQHPAMASNNVIHLTCDSRNRIWMGSPEGITWLDENRDFHRVILNDSVSVFGCRTIIETKAYGDVLYTSLGQFYYDSSKAKWKQLDWITEDLKYSRFLDAEPFDQDKIMYATYLGIYIVDYSMRKIIFEQSYTIHPVSVCRVSDNEIAVGLMDGTVQVTDIRNKKVIRELHLTNEVNGKNINTSLSEIRLAANGDILAATGFAGLVVIDKAGNVTRHTHDPIDSRSIAANNTYRVSGGIKGEVIVGTASSGLSIGNIYKKQAGYTKVFKDDAGNLFDSYLTDIAEGNNNVLWIGAYDRLIRWDRKTGKTKFFYYYFERPNIIHSLEIRTLCIDNNGKVWVSPVYDGIAVLNEASGTFKKIPVDTSKGQAARTRVINDLMAASDGNIWVATPVGVYTIHSVSLAVNTFKDHPALKEMDGKKVISLYEDKKGRIWMGTSTEGVYCFDKKENTLQHFTDKSGLLSNTCYSIFEDKRGNIYLATPAGFCMLQPDGAITSYNQKNGLRYEKCEGFLEDEFGYIWVANNKCLVRFDPARRSMRYFDEHAGISAAGFSPRSYIKTSEGELVWGTLSGINYFHTGQLTAHQAQLQVNIYQADTRDSIIHTGMDHSIRLAYAKNSIVFHFAAIDLMGSRNIRYQYMLQGYDKDWQEGTDIRQARYASLPSGHYTFLLKARADENNWIYAKNKITVRVIPPVWQQWWFIGTILALITGIIYWIISNRNRKIKEQRVEIETEQAISYFASSMSEQQTEEDILWDVVKNCIGRLQFEDCVIYLMDEENGMLIQKAAHGPKSPREFEIDKPIGIELGKGIVGSVAFTGKAEIVNDTTKDPRYIVDDEKRLSEISVPLSYDGKVLGVIDCEHSKKRFFTQKHLSILTTIASLCANKIIRARAEEERRKAQDILMSTQQKMTQVEMQALRAQMNPHFIFNCLNSINRYIVKSDQTTASLYLTKFAKLIRLILDNSNNNHVTLTNELEALKLYIEMEALRFDKKFSYEIKVEENIGTDTIELPPLIIQPYVENAIWHGLLHKENNGHLTIRISMKESMLQCVIEDNGIGREKAKELKSKTATSRKSLGMQLTENRLSLLNKHAELNASIEIIDLENGNRQAAGTKVILKIPV
jgi:ligand-binding sensor domain-containing protein/putative methionine-R-sulfoxide reductase with GAF domain/anti-sigma regulatory factor (Ser/Thr protein kinase)